MTAVRQDTVTRVLLEGLCRVAALAGSLRDPAGHGAAAADAARPRTRPRSPRSCPGTSSASPPGRGAGAARAARGAARGHRPLGRSGASSGRIQSARNSRAPRREQMASFGENLRRERELRGVDLHEMAEATKISIRFLQALEQDRVDVLPGGIFPRAFVRQYGKYLGLDPERLVAEFVFAYGGEPAPARAPSVVHGDSPRQAWIAGRWRCSCSSSRPGRCGRRARRRRAWPRRPPRSRLPRRFPQDRVYPPPAVAAATPAPSAVVVGLLVRKRAWVEARVDGSTVVNRVMEEGETQRFDAREAVTLSLGNAGGVEYTVNGRPGPALGRDGEVRRNVVITADGVAASPLVPRSPRPRRPSPLAGSGPRGRARERAGVRGPHRAGRPMSERATNPLVDQFRRGGVPKDLRLMAAQGALPLKPGDLIDLLYHLLSDPEEEVRAAAGDLARGASPTPTCSPSSRTATRPDPSSPGGSCIARTRTSARPRSRTRPRPTRPSRAWPAACPKRWPSWWSSTRCACCGAPRSWSRWRATRA